MAHTLRRSITTLAVAAGLAIGTAGTAAAQGLTHADQRRDVQSFDVQTDAPAGTTATPNVDVWRTTLRHNQNLIVARTKFADLRRTGGLHADLVRVVTNEGVRRDVTVIAAPGMWRGQAEMSRPSGTTVECAIKHKIDYTANTIEVSFPRSCVSDPRWVRLGVASVWMRSEEDNRYYADDAQLDGRINQTAIKLSPRLRRG